MSASHAIKVVRLWSPWELNITSQKYDKFAFVKFQNWREMEAGEGESEREKASGICSYTDI